MKITYFPNAIARNGVSVTEAFIESCRDHGLSVMANNEKADIAVIWSHLWAGKMSANQLVWNAFRNSGRPVIALEVGALRRSVTWRVMFNGHRKLIPGPQDIHRRQAMGLSMKPWNESGQHILIACQRGDSQQWVGQKPVDQWCWDRVQELRRYTQRPIVIRPHPRFRFTIDAEGVRIDPASKVPDTYDSYDIERAMGSAWAVINHNSNPGIDAVINGVPVFVDRTSPAAEVGNFDISQIETPSRPDREQWFNDMAWTEWHEAEIRQGLPLRLIVDHWLK